MDWVVAVSLTVGGFSILVSTIAILLSTLNYEHTKDVLAKISTQAAVIESTVNETQGKLVDTVTAIARPREETTEDKLMSTFLPLLATNPELLAKIMEISGQQDAGSR